MNAPIVISLQVLDSFRSLVLLSDKIPADFRGDVSFVTELVVWSLVIDFVRELLRCLRGIPSLSYRAMAVLPTSISLGSPTAEGPRQHESIDGRHGRPLASRVSTRASRPLFTIVN